MYLRIVISLGNFSCPQFFKKITFKKWVANVYLLVGLSGVSNHEDSRERTKPFNTCLL